MLHSTLPPLFARTACVLVIAVIFVLDNAYRKLCVVFIMHHAYEQYSMMPVNVNHVDIGRH